MAVSSILLAALSLISIGLGVLATPIPGLGAVFAFGAPALALAGVVTGGVAMSRAKRANQPRDLAVAGAVANALCFVPALLTALTCGVCNALCATGPVQMRRDFHFRVGNPGVQPPPAGQGAAGQLAPPPPFGTGGGAGRADHPNAPPPAFPPPPIDRAAP
jgi:hypothetical protein